MLYHFDCDFLVFDYLVFFDGKEVIRFGRIKGDFFFFKGVFKGLYANMKMVTSSYCAN